MYYYLTAVLDKKIKIVQAFSMTKEFNRRRKMSTQFDKLEKCYEYCKTVTDFIPIYENKGSNLGKLKLPEGHKL